MNRYLWLSMFLAMLLVATFVHSANSDVREIRKSFNQLVDDLELKEKEDIIVSLGLGWLPAEFVIYLVRMRRYR